MNSGLRDAHAKTHGCLTGTFTVSGDIPDAYRRGVFSNPGQQFSAIARFSNGAGFVRDNDNGTSLRGIGIKLFSVSGNHLDYDPLETNTQDFVMVTGQDNAFFAVRSSDYIDLQTNTSAFCARQPFSCQLFNDGRMYGSSSRNALALQFVSTVPYLHGDGQAVKYRLIPRGDTSLLMTDSKSYNFHRENIQATLSPTRSPQVSWCFEFQFQNQTDACAMPLEQPYILWNSSYTTLATLCFDPQIFTDDVSLNYCENLRFSPWHSLYEHKPLGEVARLRKLLYIRMAQIRQSENKLCNSSLETMTSNAIATSPIGSCLTSYKTSPAYINAASTLTSSVINFANSITRFQYNFTDTNTALNGVSDTINNCRTDVSTVITFTNGVVGQNFSDVPSALEGLGFEIFQWRSGAAEAKLELDFVVRNLTACSNDKQNLTTTIINFASSIFQGQAPFTNAKDALSSVLSEFTKCRNDLSSAQTTEKDSGGSKGAIAGLAVLSSIFGVWAIVSTVLFCRLKQQHNQQDTGPSFTQLTNH